ncbi:MAG: M36 family metallopeptidase, partial [Saprospiraceae bacterium]
MKRILTLLGCLLISQFLTAQDLTPQLKAKVQIARDYLKTKVLEWGIQPQEVAAWKVSNANTSKQSGVTHVYFTQTINGLEIYNAIVNVNITKEDKVLGFGNRSISNVGQKVLNNKQSLMDPSKAIELAAKQLGYPWNNQLKLNAASKGSNGAIVYDDAAISTEPIPVKQMYFPTADGKLRLCWDMSFAEKTGKEWWSLRVDAFTGAILNKTNWVKTCGFNHDEHNDQCIEKREFTNIHLNEPKLKTDQSIMAMSGTYRVYAFPFESNNFGSRTSLNPSDDSASPFGWHDTDGAVGAEYTITRGNNVYAQLDDDADNGTFGYSPDGGAGLTFDFPINFANAPSTYVDASITNLFYANNFIHDFTHRYGFDEGSGNFQANNYGNGGTGGDPVIADSQDASDVDNARFGTPAEGSSPRMSMYLFNGSPMRAGELDNLVISHEFGHGVSTRLTGGPANVECLDNDEQMGEGWSDWLGLMATMETGDQGTDVRGVGSYVFGLPITSTIRQTPYSTDMTVNPATYATAFSTVGPHELGYVWAGMLWDLSWALMDEYGQAAGFDIAMNMIIEGMKQQACSPGFVDGRDGILAADQALNGGANYCLIWKAFARRGLGVSADQGSTADRSDGIEAFDTPTSDYTLTSVPIAACYPNAAAAAAAAAMAVSTEGTPLGTVTINTLVVGTCNATVTVTATDECLNSRTV